MIDDAIETTKFTLAVGGKVPPGTLDAFTSLRKKYDVPAQRGGIAASASNAASELADALEAFKREAQMSPAQRAQRDILKRLDITEDDIKAMTPEDQLAKEQQIAEEVTRRLKLNDYARSQADSPTGTNLLATALS